jgi:hypothetical protein
MSTVGAGILGLIGIPPGAISERTMDSQMVYRIEPVQSSAEPRAER